MNQCVGSFEVSWDEGGQGLERGLVVTRGDESIDLQWALEANLHGTGWDRRTDESWDVQVHGFVTATVYRPGAFGTLALRAWGWQNAPWTVIKRTLSTVMRAAIAQAANSGASPSGLSPLRALIEGVAGRAGINEGLVAPTALAIAQQVGCRAELEGMVVGSLPMWLYEAERRALLYRLSQQPVALSQAAMTLSRVLERLQSKERAAAVLLDWILATEMPGIVRDATLARQLLEPGGTDPFDAAVSLARRGRDASREPGDAADIALRRELGWIRYVELAPRLAQLGPLDRKGVRAALELANIPPSRQPLAIFERAVRSGALPLVPLARLTKTPLRPGRRLSRLAWPDASDAPSLPDCSLDDDLAANRIVWGDAALAVALGGRRASKRWFEAFIEGTWSRPVTARDALGRDAFDALVAPLRSKDLDERVRKALWPFDARAWQFLARLKGPGGRRFAALPLAERQKTWERMGIPIPIGLRALARRSPPRVRLKGSSVTAGYLESLRGHGILHWRDVWLLAGWFGMSSAPPPARMSPAKAVECMANVLAPRSDARSELFQILYGGLGPFIDVKERFGPSFFAQLTAPLTDPMLRRYLTKSLAERLKWQRECQWAPTGRCRPDPDALDRCVYSRSEDDDPVQREMDTQAARDWLGLRGDDR